MKIETLTPQIAACYIGQKCTIHLKRQVSSMPSGTEYVTEIEPATLYLLIHDSATVAPHLRQLSSLTEAEARELYLFAHGFEYDFALSKFQGAKEWLESDEHGNGAIGSPAVWLKLLEWGFDIFGLIDAGLAKEITN